MDLSEIAHRLEAVEGLDWDNVKKLFLEERYGDFWQIGPALVPADFQPVGDVETADAAEADAVATFLQHVVADVRALLDAAQRS
ncbi:hypothetical protein ACIBKY_52070 [Nonomuraea sp. NPDC050394]|uniref:hypothetical protein n=1 Tax=Nonomuraea sp. NPDC050394 TaxID=3364363 RepID=UPI003792B103